jgi:exosortase J
VPLATYSPNGVQHTLPSTNSLMFTPKVAIGLACACAAMGLFAVYNTVYTLMDIWQTDALKSVGMAVPFVCFALILRDWREIGWETNGTWWGFVLLAVTVALVFVRDQTLLIVTVNKDWLLQLPPVPLIAVIYAASMVLLFGGPQLLRKAWFPVLLMWAVIPVPRTFSSRIDVPLQHAGATVARSFAHLIGVHLNSTDLKIMFSPDTGMFIAPGCDGLRGSITMGLTALVIAYLYRFRWYVFLPVVAGGVLLGYVFNFLRLCSMVIYDRITVSHPALGPHEPLADHIVGGCIFVIALTIFFSVANKLKQDPSTVAPAAPAAGRVRAWPIVNKAAAVIVLAAFFGADYVHTSHAKAAQSTAIPPMPASIGEYKLVRTWLDQNYEGAVAYSWGEYAAPDKAPGVPGDHVSLGLSPMQSIHDAEVCHIARGEDPIWHGQMEAASPIGPVDLTAVMYNNGVVQKLEASTVCDAGACRQYSQTSKHVTLVFAKPHKELPMQSEGARAVPLMVKVSSTDVNVPVSVAEPQMEAELAAFLKIADLLKLTAVYSKR